MEQVILVNRLDEAIGTMEKLEAHRKGLLHRAFSILIFNTNNELLIHQRNPQKYHSGGLWTNTCCGHPRPFETTQQAAERRLMEEMGFTVLLRKKFDFIYQTTFANQLIEYELDHVYEGIFNEEPVPNPAEVSDWKWVSWHALMAGVEAHPEQYTFWFREILSQYQHRELSFVNVSA